MSVGARLAVRAVIMYQRWLSPLLPPACRFEPRCPYAWDLCQKVPPELYQTDKASQFARCHLHTPAGENRRRAALDVHEKAMAVGRDMRGPV